MGPARSVARGLEGMVWPSSPPKNYLGNCFPSPQPLLQPIQSILPIPDDSLVFQSTLGSIFLDCSSILVPSSHLNSLKNLGKTQVFLLFSYFRINRRQIKKIWSWGVPARSKCSLGHPKRSSKVSNWFSGAPRWCPRAPRWAFGSSQWLPRWAMAA